MDLSPSDRMQVLGLACLSGILLLLAQQAFERDWAWFAEASVRCLWFTLAIGLPLTVAMLLGQQPIRRAYALAGGVGLLLALLAWHTGSAYVPDQGLRSGAIFPAYVGSVLLAWLLILPWLQLAGQQPPWPYAQLFWAWWDNLLSLLTALLFTLLAWLILWLGAALFAVIGFDFFEDLLQEELFIFPASGLMVGFGLTVGRSYLGVMREGLRICLGLATLLLPLQALISLFFCAFLLAGTIAALWQTGRAAALLLGLVAVGLALLKGVYQAGERPRLQNTPWRQMVLLGSLSWPIFIGLGAYALCLRVEQYGWTVDRFHGLLAILALGTLAMGVAASALADLRGKGYWPALAALQRYWGLGLGLILLLSQSPLLDFRALSARSQVQQFEQRLSSYDLNHLRFALGRPGLEAVQNLQSHPEVQADPVLQEQVRSTLEARQPVIHDDAGSRLQQAYAAGQVDIRSTIPYDPQIIPDVVRSMAQQMQGPRSAEALCSPERNACLLLGVDLDRQFPQEWVFRAAPYWTCRMPVVGLVQGSWQGLGWLSASSGECEEDWLSALDTEGQVRTEAPQFDDLRVGDLRYRLQQD